MYRLIEHGLKNVWCTPKMDRQVILVLVRVSRSYGSKRNIKIGWFDFKLPTNTGVFHCFLIGNLPRTKLGIDTRLLTNIWYDIDFLMNRHGVIYNFYIGAGLEITRNRVKLRLLENGSFIVAIKEQDYPFSIKDKIVYMRVYKNSFFETDRFDLSRERIELDNIDIHESDPSEVVNFINNHNSKNNRDYGLAMGCVNGIWYKQLNVENINEKTVIDSLFDGSIREVMGFRINDLKSFTSTIHENRKYLIHVDKLSAHGITYFDDIDFLVSDEEQIDFSLGVRIPRNRNDVINQITHNDYSVSVDAVENIGKRYFNGSTDLYLKLVTREAGYDRSLWYVSDKIRALYKLKNEDILNALLGIDSTVAFWRADYLENGSYSSLMGKKEHTVDLDDVVECYGYRGIVKAVSDTPIIVNEDSVSVIDIPVNFQPYCLAIEYTRWGKIYHYSQYADKKYYPIASDDCAWVEFLKGLADRKVYIGYNQESFTISKKYNYSFFKRDKEAKSDWVDVTGSGDYTNTETSIKWEISLDKWEVCALCDNRIYNEEIELSFYKQHLLHTFTVDISPIEADEEYIDGSLNLNHYRIWLNNRALIRNVDFKIKGEILYIVNKEYLDSSKTKQELLIIADGIVLNTWYDDSGYVVNGKISFNKRYDYYDDRLLRVIVEGKVYPIEALLSVEEDRPLYLPIRNGCPYLVENVSPGLKDPDIDFQTLLQDALLKEEELGAYLTVKIPEIEDDEIEPIPDYYLLYSPLISIIIYEMNNGRIHIPDGRVTDEDIDIIVNPYKYIIEFDPSTWELDNRYISIHPHPYRHTLTVTDREFMVLERINDIYLGDVADLTPFLQIS